MSDETKTQAGGGNVGRRAVEVQRNHAERLVIDCETALEKVRKELPDSLDNEAGLAVADRMLARISEWKAGLVSSGGNDR